MGAVEVVSRLEFLVNDRDVDAVVGLFTPDAEVVIPALSPRVGLEAIRGLFEFCAGIEMRWEVKEAHEIATGAACQVDQYDGWATLIGLAPLRYEMFEVDVSGGVISAIRGEWSLGTLQALGASLEGFTPWATAHHPELYDTEGDFRYTREAGAGFIRAAAEWLRAG